MDPNAPQQSQPPIPPQVPLQPYQQSAQPYPPHAVPQDDTAMQRMIPTKNMPALLSYYFGVFGLIPFLGFPLAIVAIVLGVMGMNQFKQKPTPGAKGHAITGLVLGIFEVVCMLVFVVLVIVLNHHD